MSVIENHYESLLASRYTWMMGGAEQCAANARSLLDAARLSACESAGIALDLGSGPGYHAKALAQRGFRVIAVDVSESCLQELRADCAGLNVETILGELTDPTTYSRQGPFTAILCVGDTLTHLSSTDDVNRLLHTSFDLLAPNGVLLLDFREQPVDAKNTIFTTRAERDRIMQCMLQLEPARVWVTDIVHEWTGDRWTTIQSTYPKLRLSGDEIRMGRRTLALEKPGR